MSEDCFAERCPVCQAEFAGAALSKANVEIARLQAVVEKATNIELLASEFVYKHTVSYLAPCKTRSLRWDELTDEQKEPYRKDAAALSAWLTGEEKG